MLSPQELEIIKAGRALGKPPEEIEAKIKAHRSGYVPLEKSGTMDLLRPAQSSYSEQVSQVAQAGFERMKEGYRQGQTSEGNPLELIEGGIKQGEGLAQAVSAPLAPFFSPIAKMIESVGDTLSEAPAVQEFAESSAGQTTARVAEDVAGLTTIAGTLAGGKSTPKVASAIQRAIPETPPSITLPTIATPKVRQTIIDNYTKAIKPTVAGQKSPQLLDRYNDSVFSSVRSIVQNKDNLTFVTPDGEQVTGRLPETVGEFTQAIDNTKAKIFSEYNALTQQATGKGVQVSTEPAIAALDKVVSSEALRISHPEAVSHAQTLIDRLTVDGVPKQLKPDVAQEVIKNYNASLEKFYRNPSYESASKAAVEAGIMYQMREALDAAITGATGEEYSALKKQYAALKQIEADASKRAVVLARQNSATGMSGIADYAAIFSGGDIVNGILSLNPAQVGKGAVQLGLTKLFTYLKSPDRAIKNMFKAADLEATKSVPLPPEPQSAMQLKP